ncbi:MAG TPA: phosphoglucosamine mutase [Nitrososphaeraceae archaeon]|jgi:phosphomannomutase/phosphoglucomutase
MQSGKRIFGTNGVRGIFGRDFEFNLIMNLTYSLATFFKSGRILLGRDVRLSSPIVSRLVGSVINSAGLDVWDAGIIPTPCLQFATKKYEYTGGVMITASHNPPEYNGIKPIASDGVELSRDDELKVEEIFSKKNYTRMDGCGVLSQENNIINPYIETVLSLVNADYIRSRKFKVIMDLGNGVQGAVAPFLLQKLGCHVITINGEMDGNFPGRGSEPTTNNLSQLSQIVRDLDADLGVAYDGDGDRSIFCDEKGIAHTGDKTGTLLVRYLIRARHTGAEIVCPINTTMLLSKVAEEEKSKVSFTKVGSVEVSRQMLAHGSIIGMEENGGFMYGKMNEVRDGAMTTALLLEMLASSTTRESLSQMLNKLPKTYQFKTKFECGTNAIANKAVDSCLAYKDPIKTETIDGAKIWPDNDSWLLVRPSGTEPLLRLYAESMDESRLSSMVHEYSSIIENVLRETSPD